ncbi:MAG: hypothetical protein K8R40_10125, partial [Anaerolineaceae bacterium]|nr:hypothetical protein [Anaerolineaceae bacterium]
MGESVKEAVLREILEETPAKAQVERLLNVYEYVP